MRKIRQINIKNRTYYFCNDQIDLKDFVAKFLKIDKKDYKEIDIYYLGYVTIKKIVDYNNNINSVNPLYLMIDEMTGHIDEKYGKKYLVLDEIDENKEVLKKYKEVWEGIKKEIETIDNDKKFKYGEDLKKNRFEYNDRLQLNKQLKFYNVTIIIRSVFNEKNNFYYPQLFLDDGLYEL